jgi:hypothetical protein
VREGALREARRGNWNQPQEQREVRDGVEAILEIGLPSLLE